MPDGFLSGKEPRVAYDIARLIDTECAANDPEKRLAEIVHRHLAGAVVSKRGFVRLGFRRGSCHLPLVVDRGWNALVLVQDTPRSVTL